MASTCLWPCQLILPRKAYFYGLIGKNGSLTTSRWPHTAHSCQQRRTLVNGTKLLSCKIGNRHRNNCRIQIDRLSKPQLIHQTSGPISSTQPMIEQYWKKFRATFFRLEWSSARIATALAQALNHDFRYFSYQRFLAKYQGNSPDDQRSTKS